MPVSIIPQQKILQLNAEQMKNKRSLCEERTKLLSKFLSKNGLTVPFLLGVKKQHQCQTIQEYVEWLHYTKFNFNNAFYLAFYWAPNDPIPWKEHAKNWKAFLKGGTPYGPA
jgi:hypothetical protein